MQKYFFLVFRFTVDRFELWEDVKILCCCKIFDGIDDWKEVGYKSDEISIWFELRTSGCILNTDKLLFLAPTRLFGNNLVDKSTLLLRFYKTKVSPSLDEISSFSYRVFGLELFCNSPAFSTFFVIIFYGELASLIFAELVQLRMLFLKFWSICSETVIEASMV